MHTLLRTLAAPLLVALAACGGPEISNHWMDEEAGEAAAAEGDRFAIQTRNDEVKLGLTNQVVYFRLSDGVLGKVDREMGSAMEGKSGLGASIAGVVTQSVSQALRHRMQYPIEEVRDIRYEDGRLVFQFESSDTRMPDMEVNGEPLETAFAPEDAQRFAQAFRELRDGR